MPPDEGKIGLTVTESGGSARTRQNCCSRGRGGADEHWLHAVDLLSAAFFMMLVVARSDPLAVYADTVCSPARGGGG